MTPTTKDFDTASHVYGKSRMYKVRSAGADPAPYCTLPGQEITSTQLARQHPDELLLAWTDDRAAARCGLWWNDVAAYPDHKLGIIGHYFADSPAAGETILNAACERLAKERCTLAVGPMDGNTWQRYRFITDRGAEPSFFLEPDNPDDWPRHWTAVGFTPLATYHSGVATDLATRDPRAEETARRLVNHGIIVRNISLANFDSELAALHALSLTCFANNFLYTLISLADFTAQYAQLRNHLRPELTLLAEKKGELVGFIFAVPDLLQMKQGKLIDTAIAKTMAVHPDCAGIGLGSHLMDRLHAAMHAAGFRRAIHALFHAGNRSGRISRHTANVIRTYTLFRRALGGNA
jgi:GNAT superfamily N-acetyltransferase